MIKKSLNLGLFCYVFGIFIFSKIEGFSLMTNVFLLFLLCILAIIWSRNSLTGLKNIFLILPVMFILFCSVFWSGHPEEATISFLSFFATSLGGMVVFLALMNGANPKVVFAASLLGSGYLVYSAWQEKSTLMLSRVAGLAGNANDLAITLIIAGMLISLNAIYCGKWPKIYALFLLIFSVSMTGSRKTLFALILIPFIWLWSNFSSGLKKRVLKKMAFVLAVTLTVCVVFGPTIWEGFSNTATWKRTIQAIDGKNNSTNTRKSMIVDGLSLWKAKPILGYGISQFRYESVYGTYSHNNYVEILSSVGIVGFILFYAVYVILFIKIKKISTSDRVILTFSLLLLLLWDMALVSYCSKTIWLLLGVCLWVSQKDRHRFVCRPRLRAPYSGPRKLDHLLS